MRFAAGEGPPLMSAPPLRQVGALSWGRQQKRRLAADSRRSGWPRVLHSLSGEDGQVSGTATPQRLLDHTPTRDEAIALLGGADDAALLAAAAALRDRGKGRV